MKGKFFLVSVLVPAYLLTGCITVFVPVITPTPPPTPTAIILPTLPPPPTATIVASPTTVQPAPVCSVDPFAGVCTVPSVSGLSKSCIAKIPYTLVGITPGSTFEILDEGMTCRDEKVRGGVQQYSCTGEQLYSYEVKVCNAACAAPSLQTDSARCAEGFGYSAAAGCCWSTSALEAGCVIYKVDIGGCQ